MIGAASVDGVDNVIEDVFAGRQGGRSYDVRHEVDAEVATAIGEQLENLIGLVAGMCVNRGAAGVRDENGLLRFRDTFRGRAISAVAQVDGHSGVVHLLNGGDACFAEAGIAWFEAAVAKYAAVIVGELHDADAQAAEDIDALGVLFQE